MLDFLLEIVLGGFKNCLQAISALLCDVRDPAAKRMQRRAGSGLLVGSTMCIVAVLMLLFQGEHSGFATLLLLVGVILIFWAGHEGAKVEKIYLAEPPQSKAEKDADGA